jgi:hypothetical protein
LAKSILTSMPALPVVAGLCGALSAMVFVEPLGWLSSLEGCLFVAAIGAIPGGFFVMCMVMVMTLAGATSMRQRKVALAIALLIGTLIGGPSPYCLFLFMISRVGVGD